MVPIFDFAMFLKRFMKIMFELLNRNLFLELYFQINYIVHIIHIVCIFIYYTIHIPCTYKIVFKKLH